MAWVAAFPTLHGRQTVSRTRTSSRLALPLRRPWKLTCWLDFAGVTLLAMIIGLQYQPDSQPIMGDQAYFLYMAQAVQRGEPVYKTTTFGYTPLVPLLSAGAMQVAETLGLPGFLGPRYFSVAITALSCGLLYLITARASRSRWIGVVTALALLNFDFLLALTASNFEPKILVQFLTLLTIAALQRRLWGLAGAAAGLAAISWQPALIVGAAASLLALYEIWKRDRSALPAYVGGFLLGTLPLYLYLGLTAQWDDFIQQAVAFKLHPRPEITQTPGVFQPLIPVIDLLQALRVYNFPFFVLALAGIGMQVIRAWRRGMRYLRLIFTQPRTGGVLLLTIFWLGYALLAAFSGVEFQGIGDALPFLYLVAFWAAWGCYRLLAWWAHRSRVGSASLAYAPFFFVIVFLLGAAGKAFPYQAQYELDTEIALIRSGLPTENLTGPLLAINAPEVYVLLEQPSPWRYLFVTPYFAEFIEWKEAEGCNTLVQDLEQSHFSNILIKLHPKYENPCLQQIVERLNAGYPKTELATNLNLQWCHTRDLLMRFSQPGAWAVGGEELQAWVDCMLSKRVYSFQQTNEQRYWVYRSAGEQGAR